VLACNSSFFALLSKRGHGETLFPDCLSLQVILTCSSFARLLLHAELKPFKALQSFGSELPEGDRKKEL